MKVDWNKNTNTNINRRNEEIKMITTKDMIAVFIIALIVSTLIVFVYNGLQKKGRITDATPENRYYCNKIHTIKAFKFGDPNQPKWFKEAVREDYITVISQYAGEEVWCEVQTLKGTKECNEGDFITLDSSNSLDVIPELEFIHHYREIKKVKE